MFSHRLIPSHGDVVSMAHTLYRTNSPRKLNDDSIVRSQSKYSQPEFFLQTITAYFCYSDTNIRRFSFIAQFADVKMQRKKINLQPDALCLNDTEKTECVWSSCVNLTVNAVDMVHPTKLNDTIVGFSSHEIFVVGGASTDSAANVIHGTHTNRHLTFTEAQLAATSHSLRGAHTTWDAIQKFVR